MEVWISQIFGYHGYLDVMATSISGIFGYHLYSDILAIRISWKSGYHMKIDLSAVSDFPENGNYGFHGFHIGGY